MVSTASWWTKSRAGDSSSVRDFERGVGLYAGTMTAKPTYTLAADQLSVLLSMVGLSLASSNDFSRFYLIDKEKPSRLAGCMGILKVAELLEFMALVECCLSL